MIFFLLLCFFVFFQCDPYIRISLGRKTIDDRDNYKPNTLNPEFGRYNSCLLIFSISRFTQNQLMTLL